MSLPNMSGIARMIYDGAAKLKEEMSRPDGQPEKLDYSITASCFHCDVPISRFLGSKPLVCSACKSAVYCSKKCQIANWKNGRLGMDCHKVLCEGNKRHMLKVPQVRGIIKLFPWGRVESDGTFSDSLIRAYFGVYGASGYGYWSEAGGSAPHQAQPNVMGTLGNPLVDPAKGYQDGYLLLLDQHPDEKAGWKLEDRLIPKLQFGPVGEPLVGSSADVVDWESWYRWRSLPLESPAALLMHYPLTVYHLLVNVLNVASPSRGSPDDRQTLYVQYLGAEVELNMLPLFSELALLLPYTDIKIKLIGYAVYTIVQKASKKSIAAKAKRNEPVYTYKGPLSVGQSTLAIYLDGDHQHWEPRYIEMTNDVPDAIVALNAGLASYSTWADVILFCLIEGVPFGATEYTEQSAEVQRESFPKIISHAMPHFGPRMSAAQVADLTQPREYPIVFNPFQCPGQRPIGATRLPNVSNGFTLRVVGGDSVKGRKEYSLIEQLSRMDVAPEKVQQLLDKMKGMSFNNLD